MKENSIHIGLVGLGIIGSSIFRNVSKSDFKTTGFDIDQEKLDELSSEGLFKIAYGLKCIRKAFLRCLKMSVSCVLK